MSRVYVIGGGPAGMMAACAAADAGHEVTLFERNEKLGKKLYITGKGRCNVTNACETQELFSHVLRNPKFLYTAFYTFDNRALMDFIEENGTSLKVERGNRVFPVSDHSSDILAACERALKKRRVRILLRHRVTRLDFGDGRCRSLSVKKDGGEELQTALEDTAHVIVATGGLSYVSTGSDGDGYRFAGEAGHTLTAREPSLVPLNAKEDWVRSLQGLSLRNVSAKLCDGPKTLYEDFGELLFTHFGVSGPLILSASAHIPERTQDRELTLWIDLKPALDEQTLDQRILREFEQAKNRDFANASASLFPASLRPVMVELSGIGATKKVHEITRGERRDFVTLIKHLPVTITGKRGWKEAIITRGGVSVREIDPSTMRSRRISNLSFCGEVLDLDACTGGYNLQIAWSTGYLAGSRA